MKLAYPLLDSTIVFDEAHIPVIVIENIHELRRAVCEMRQQTLGESGSFVLSENDKIIEISKNLCFVADPFSLDFDSKKIISKINQEALSSAVGYADDVSVILSQINVLASKICNDMSFDIACNDIEDIDGIIKLLSFHIDSDGLSFPEKILEYLRIQHIFCGIKLCVFFNLKSMLDEKELSLLYEQIIYEKLNVLLIEDTVRLPLPQIEKTVIIDKDLCIL